MSRTLPISGTSLASGSIFGYVSRVRAGNGGPVRGMCVVSLWTLGLSGLCGSARAGASAYLLDGERIVEFDFDTLSVGAVRATGVEAGVEMAFSDAGELFVSRLAGMSRVDLGTGNLETVLTPADVDAFLGFRQGAFAGMTFDEDGELVVAIHAFRVAGTTSNWYAEYDLRTQTRLSLFEHTPLMRHPCFDLLVLNEQTMLSVDYRDDRVWSVDRTTGHAFVLGTGVEDPVSFFETGDGLYLLTRQGGVYQFDASTGAASFHGSISGLTGDLIGSAVVPAPGAWAVLGVGGLAWGRQRVRCRARNGYKPRTE